MTMLVLLRTKTTHRTVHWLYLY